MLTRKGVRIIYYSIFLTLNAMYDVDGRETERISLKSISVVEKTLFEIL